MPDDESALMGGQSVDDDGGLIVDDVSMSPTSMTLDEFVDAVSASVSSELSARLDALECRFEAVAGRAQLDGLSERVDALSSSVATQEDLRTASASLSAGLEQATLQAGELVPIGEDDIGTVIAIVGQLLDAFDSDGDGASDVSGLVSEIRTGVQDIAGVLVHPALDTPFADYTVLEALLLLLLFWQVIKFWVSRLEAGFSWLS